MTRHIFALLPFLLSSLASTSAEAVQTRHCPEMITLALSGLNVFSMQDVRGIERHARYTKEMLEETSASRDRAEKHLPSSVSETTFFLKKRENARCTYWSEGMAFYRNFEGLNARKIVLYTKSGTNYLREEFQLPYRRRDSETFLVESELAEYSVEGVKLSKNINSPLKVTVRYPCYDHRCLSEAIIGQASQDAR